MENKTELAQFYRGGNAKYFESAIRLELDEEQDMNENALDTLYQYSKTRLLNDEGNFMGVMFDSLTIAYRLGYLKGGTAAQHGEFKTPFRVPF